MPAGTILTAEATITTQTDTALIAAVESDQHVEILDLSIFVWVLAASAKLRFESAAGSGLLAGLGIVDGSALGRFVLNFETPHGGGGYKIAAAKGLSIETSGGNATYYCYVRYKIVPTPA